LLGCFTKRLESERNGEEEREKVRHEERKMNEYVNSVGFDIKNKN